LFASICFVYSKWTLETINYVNSLACDDCKNELDQTLNEFESRCECFTKLSRKQEAGFIGLKTDYISLISKYWTPFEVRWRELEKLLRNLQDVLNSNDGLKSIMSDFEAIEKWLDVQESKITTSISEEFENELENELSNQIELEEYLKIQDEKVRSACSKVDIFHDVRDADSIDSDSLAPYLQSNMHAEHRLETIQENEHPLEIECDRSIFDVQQVISSSKKDVGENIIIDNMNKKREENVENSFHVVTKNLEECVIDDSNELEKGKSRGSSQPSMALVGLLKKTQLATCNNDNVKKKRVVFSAKHEFSDCSGTIQIFHKLNDEYDENFNRDYDLSDSADDIDCHYNGHSYHSYVDDNGDFDDDCIIFSEQAPSPPYYPTPPEDFLQFEDSEDSEEGEEEGLYNMFLFVVSRYR
jgi:hypothetical protein